MISRERTGTDYFVGAHWFHGVVAIFLICLFSLWLVLALLDAEEVAEKMVVEATERNMRVELKLAIGALLIAGRDSEIPKWVGSNPVLWMGAPPVGYLGDCPAGGVARLPEAAWCFDVGARQLLYRPRHSRHLHMRAGEDADKVLRWQVERVKTETKGGWVSVELVTPYSWLVE